MAKRCRVCAGQGKTFLLSLDVSHKGVRRQWLIEVCQGCWRVFETMLDEAMVGMQLHLGPDGDRDQFLV